jgi:2-succinyl-6-hydroxy-2,4-cyclohexadiene-1-carboxylate synthase
MSFGGAGADREDGAARRICLVAESARVAGSERERVVLLHGFGGTHRAWDQVLAHLPAERYRSLALDLPGHGRQVDAPRPITFDGCVASVLDRGLERFVLVGYSMGGRIALHVALAAPERIERLVLISTTAGIEDPAERVFRREHDRRLADEIEGDTIEMFSERWRAQPMFAEDPRGVDRLARADQARNRPEGVAAALRGIGTGEMAPLWERLSELGMPVTVIVGDRDVKFHALGRRMAESVADGTLVLARGGHVLPIESPTAIVDALEGH